MYFSCRKEKLQIEWGGGKISVVDFGANHIEYKSIKPELLHMDWDKIVLFWFFLRIFFVETTIDTISQSHTPSPPPSTIRNYFFHGQQNLDFLSKPY